jgi:uncharacterized protein
MSNRHRPDPNPVRGDLRGRRRTWGAFADGGRPNSSPRCRRPHRARIVGTAAPREPPRRSVASAAKRWVGLYDAAEDQIAIMGWDGLGQPAHPSFPRSEGLSGAAVATGQVVIVGDVCRRSSLPQHARDHPFGDRRPGVGAGGRRWSDRCIDVESELVDAFDDGDGALLRRCAGWLARFGVSRARARKERIGHELTARYAGGSPRGWRTVTGAGPTARTRVRRLPERGAYDRATIDGIVDEALFCHVGFVVDWQPYVIPTIHARAGDRLYLHGSAASRMLRTVSEGIPVCVTVTIPDGLVLARSAFHHSINYRSVVILGTAAEVTRLDERLHALEALSEHVTPGRWADVRPPNESELRQTRIVSIAIDEASAKIRSGGPKDDDEDLALPVWSGVLPLRLVARAPVADDHVPTDALVPDYLGHHRLSGP